MLRALGLVETLRRTGRADTDGKFGCVAPSSLSGPPVLFRVLETVAKLVTELPED